MGLVGTARRMHRRPFIEVVLRVGAPNPWFGNDLSDVLQFMRDEAHQLRVGGAGVDNDPHEAVGVRRGDADKARPDAVAALSRLDVHVAVARVDSGDEPPKRRGTVECVLHDCGDCGICRPDV